jgi:hypothetical protein
MSSMFVLTTNRCEGGRKSEYATCSDFCAIFIECLERLYLLALLLSGDQIAAEQCFTTASGLCMQGSHAVFKHSAASWCRRSVIKTAINIACPVPNLKGRPHSLGNHGELNLGSRALLKRIQELPLFDRFVFVMSVLERYSDRECSVLLSCAVADILPARIRAMQQLSVNDQSNRSTYTTIDPCSVDADWLECG